MVYQSPVKLPLKSSQGRITNTASPTDSSHNMGISLDAEGDQNVTPK